MATTLLVDGHETELPTATADGDHLWIPLDDLSAATGWSASPAGLCQGELCVPVPRSAPSGWLDDDGRRFDFAAFAAHQRRALARDPAHDVWAFGPAVGPGLGTGMGPVDAPDFRLADVDGRTHALSDYRGHKVLVYCWASW